MSKAKGISLIRGKEPVLKMALCAVEYDTGELYYDRMGRVVRQLNRADSGWLRDAAVSGKQTQLLNPSAGLILNVSNTGAALALSTETGPEGIEAENVALLAEQSAIAFGVVVDELELEQFQRIGYREHFYFACSSIEETETWIKDLGLVQAEDALFATFGKYYALNWSLMFVAEECRYRLELRGVERQATVPVGPSELTIKHSRAKHLNRSELLQLLVTRRHQQKDPEYAAVVDIDAFLWDDVETDFDIPDFITQHAANNLNMFRKCLPK